MERTGRDTAAVLLSMVLAVSGAGAMAADRPGILLYLVDLAGVPTTDLARARAEVEHVFEAAGVDIAWSESAPPLSPGDPAEARVPWAAVVLLNDTQERTRGATGCALGAARPALARAYVLYNRVASVAGTGPVDHPIVLARVMAHEIGHLLLPRGHASFGIMRADLDLGYSNPSRFTSDQAKTIRSRLVSGPSPD